MVPVAGLNGFNKLNVLASALERGRCIDIEDMLITVLFYFERFTHNTFTPFVRPCSIRKYIVCNTLMYLWHASRPGLRGVSI